jgi:exodeoxyribonuclease-3
MKLISWNVNGLRACLKKGFLDFFVASDADIFCLQETKMQEGQAEIAPPGYVQVWNSAEKKGYSGTAIFTKREPRAVTKGIGIPAHDGEGRVITLEFDAFYMVDVYTPNSQDELRRLAYRMEWDDAFRAYLRALDAKKPLVVCGDMNVAHREIDLKNPKTNHKNPGFSDEERGKMTQLLSAGFADTFRVRYPDRADAYSWWSYRAGARARNVGWRIDYFIVSRRLTPRIRDAMIFPEVEGSDHCPVGLLME